MRNRFFLAYLPLMIICGIISICLAAKYDDRSVIMGEGYRAGNKASGTYEGYTFGDETDAEQRKNQKKFNGSELKDNGMPYAIKVNKTKNVVTVYEADDKGVYSKPVKAMVCSVGAAGNTPTGIFRLGERHRWRALFGDCYGQYAVKITGNILFHSVPYYTYDKSDLEVDEYNMLGESVSAGCVRLSVIDVKWIYDNCDTNTFVEIFESDYEGPMGKPVAAKIAKMDDNNWDPTDPDTGNPYMANAPLILGVFDREIERYSDFDITAGVTAIDKDGNDITDHLKIKGSVNGSKCGEYPVTYAIETDEDEEVSVTAVFYVKDDGTPVLQINQVVTSIGVNDVGSGKQLLELLRRNVTAIDDGMELPKESILVDYSEILDTTLGTCHIKYRAKDSEGNTSDIAVLTVDVDLEAPSISLKDENVSEIHMNRILDDDYLLGFVEAADNSGYVDVELSRPLLYQEGEPYKVIYYAKDKAGNITTLNVTYQLKN
ncbi:MAG: DUF5011 domain-containing protein [Lachnospiraceae bacterium]|nr:DUF5011 domain-containing protein [Lachnospiraceae bacterium]